MSEQTEGKLKELRKLWFREGEFHYGSYLYKRNVNDYAAREVLHGGTKKMTGPIHSLPSELTLTNADMDNNIHQGFTVGRGKVMYWEMIWTKSGNVTVYGDNNKSRWLSGDQIVTVHFK